MVTSDQALATALACVVLIAVPGPSVMFVVGRALSYGRTNALASVAGNAIGCYLVGVVIALGLGPLLERSEGLFQAIKWAGVAYLVWLGYQAIRHAGPASEQVAPETRSVSTWAAVRTGTIVGLTNPKSFVLFTATCPSSSTRAEAAPPPRSSCSGPCPWASAWSPTPPGLWPPVGLVPGSPAHHDA